jgi:site-specific DNA-methyltransferase (adenine-specific)
MIYQGDCLDILPTIEANSIDSIVTDPPYGLSFMGKDWDYGVPGVHFWVEALRVAKPGAFLLAFGGTRTFHRLTVAIEDAGWEIRDCIGWLYGSGFPKSLNVGNGFGTALKPAWEPIIVARKPIVGTVANNVLKYGTGAMNIDASRIGTKTELHSQSKESAAHNGIYGKYSGLETQTVNKGRFPANIIHDGSDEVLAVFPVNKSTIDKSNHAGRIGTSTFTGNKQVERIQRGDSGSAARFFYCAKASKQDRDEGCGELPLSDCGMMEDDNYPIKTGSGNLRETKRHNNHPTVKPTNLMRYLCKLVTPPGGTILDPFMGSGSTGKAAALEGFRFIGIELESDYTEIAGRRIKAVQPLFAGV